MEEKIKGHLLLLWSQLRKGIFRMLSANVLNKMIQMLSNMAITRLLTKPEYGLWSYVLNIYSYLNLLSGLGLLSGAFQYGTENRNKKEEFEYYRYCLKCGAIVDTGLLVFFLIGAYFVNMALEGAKVYVCFYVPIILLEYFLTLFLTVLRCENRISEYAHILNFNTLLMAIGTCVGAIFGITGVIIGKYFAVTISILHLMKKIHPEIEKIRAAKILSWNQVKSLWHYSLFVGACSTMNQLLYLLDISMIAELISNPIDVANYKAATLIPTALGFIPNSVVIAVLPNIINNKDNKKWLNAYIKKLYFYMAVLNIGICTCLICLAPWIIRIISGVQYLPAVPIFRILVIEYFFNGTLRMLSVNVLAGLRFINYELVSSVITAACNIGFNYYLIKMYGTIGAAYATLGAMAVAGILSFSFLYFNVLRNKKGSSFSEI